MGSSKIIKQIDQSEQPTHITDATQPLPGANKTVALALGSGGARGAAHIGVIDALERRGYRIIAISGCSMGAIIGGFYSADKLPMFRRWLTELSYLDMLKLVDISLLSSSMIRGDRVFKKLSEMLDCQRIEGCRIPFTAIATDLRNRKEVWFQDGLMDEALRASSAIPSILSPVSQRGRLLVDGGLLNPLPISPCVSAHADLIIAVDLNADVPLPSLDHYDYPISPNVADFDTETIKANIDDLSQDNLESQSSGDGQLGDWWKSLSELGFSLMEKLDSPQTDFTDLPTEKQIIRDDLGKLEILNQMFEVMQRSLAQFKTAGYPPDLLIRVPSQICQSHDFHRAQEMIDQGDAIATSALNSFENGHSSIYGQLNH